MCLGSLGILRGALSTPNVSAVEVLNRKSEGKGNCVHGGGGEGWVEVPDQALLIGITKRKEMYF